MKYQAVIFDLSGTLIDNWAPAKVEAFMSDMAFALSVPQNAFAELWRGDADERMRAKFGGMRATLEKSSLDLGTQPDLTTIAGAIDLWLDFGRQMLEPRSHAIDTLERLKSSGLKLGVLSDCTAEVPALWPETPFAPLVDTQIFSCDVGMRKPDPRICQMALEHLGAEPSECLYVGDGLSNELTGASAVGMDVVQIYVPYADEWRDANAEEWDGPTISALKEVLKLV